MLKLSAFRETSLFAVVMPVTPSTIPTMSEFLSMKENEPAMLVASVETLLLKLFNVTGPVELILRFGSVNDPEPSIDPLVISDREFQPPEAVMSAVTLIEPDV